MLTHLSLFTGIGGLDLAAEWAGFTAIGQCEYADYPHKVLCKHWPDVPKWRDIRTLTGDDFFAKTGRRTVDVLSGGFPCQPFSVAGKRGGAADDRYLWPEMFRVIRELRPSWVVGENVAGFVSMALDTALSDLENEGYICRTFVLPACGVGALHQRYRVFIVAHTGGLRCRGARNVCDLRNIQEANHVRTSDRSFQSGEISGDVAHHEIKGERRLSVQPWGSQQADANTYRGGKDGGSGVMVDALCGGCAGDNRGREWAQLAGGCRRAAQPGLGGMADGLPDWVDGYWDIEPDIPRVATGINDRVARLKGLGNAVVPQQAYPIFSAIAEIMRATI